jgi:hypothetical protein
METTVKKPQTLQEESKATLTKCNHRRSNGDGYATINHTFLDGTWLRCLRCGRTWQGMEPGTLAPPAPQPGDEVPALLMDVKYKITYGVDSPSRSVVSSSQIRGPVEHKVVALETERRIKDAEYTD